MEILLPNNDIGIWKAQQGKTAGLSHFVAIHLTQYILCFNLGKKMEKGKVADDQKRDDGSSFRGRTITSPDGLSMYKKVCWSLILYNSLT